MRNRLTLTLALFTIGASAQIKEAKEVISTFAPGAKVELSLIEKQNGRDRFETSVKDGTIHVKGSSGTALCRGFYDYVTSNGYGINSWSGNRSAIPSTLADASPKEVVSPVEHHFYFNVVTPGYSTPYWGWERWNQEIDYMALHGIDMPLALVANEAISARVWKRLGLTDEEISAYFVGPAHFPWMRMGNVSGIDGPLPDSWHADQIALQHKILGKMRGLGMKPICPAFAGFIPKQIKRIYPDVELVETAWGGAFNNWMLSPKSELFSKVGTMFIEEWEKEFGKNIYYLADSFNEMEIPFPPIGTDERYNLLKDYGEILYKSIHAANPDAVWVMQGWMFGYQRHIWEPKTLEALCERVPNDKMLLLDEAVDYNKHFWGNGYNWDFYKGYYGKPWIYASIPNMGGKCGLTGVLEFYANGHLAALRSENRGRLSGFGMAPEGIENNEVIYELITDAGWRSDSVDVKKWLHNYSVNRYGRCTASVDSAWTYLLKSVYGTFTDHPRYNWQLRPGTYRKGSINASPDFFRAIEFFANAEYDDSELYKVDLAEFAAAYIGGKIEILTMAIENAYLLGDTEQAKALESRFLDLAMKMDLILESHPTHRLGRWIEFARQHGETTELADYYERNARRIVTIWGPPVDDYSARIWAGLIRDYYVPRWKAYFESKHSGVAFDHKAMAEWERQWVEEKRGLSPVRPYKDVMRGALAAIKEAGDISMNTLPNSVGSWDSPSSDKPLKFTLSVAQVQKMKGVRFSYVRGEGELTIESISIEMDGKKVAQDASAGVVSPSKRNYDSKLKLPADATGNNSCELIVKASGKGATSGNIELILQ